MRPKGFLTLARVVRTDGRPFSTQDAVDSGLVRPVGHSPHEWGIERHEIPLGWNNFTDSGRQALAYAFGFRRPIVNFVCTQFGIGTGTTPAAVTDTSLESPLTFYDSNSDTVADSQLKPVGKASFPSPFIVDFEIPIASTEANGHLITEFGLFSGNGTFLARYVGLGYQKTNDLAPTFIYRIRL